jgi:O-antigen/teichoic acid export membrane protein
LIIAHEDMNIYAYVSIIEVLLKLGIIFILQLVLFDKLQLYGILMCIVTIINTTIYWTICRVKYQRYKFKFYWNKALFKEITSYTGWNLFGSISVISRNQIITLLLNQFFNPVIVTARGIALSVNNTVSSFSGNFYNAMRPQIIKSYAANKEKEIIYLVFYSAKITYFLMYIFILPLILELPLIFTIWLKSPPQFAVLFTRLTLFEMLINAITMPLGAVVHATGKIKLYQSVYYGVLLLNLPTSWIALSYGAPAHSVMIISICLTFIDAISVLFIVKKVVGLSISNFFKNVILSMVVISVISAILPLGVFTVLSKGFIRFCTVVIISIISVCTCMYFIGLNKYEQNKIKQLIHDKFIIKSGDKI